MDETKRPISICLSLDHPTYYKHFLENPEDKNRASWKAGSISLEESWEADRVGRTEVGTWRCKLLMRQVMPKATSRKLVRVKALMALVSFWILR